nr:hypothetical protein [Tanacetum cinerariifolium]
MTDEEGRKKKKAPPVGKSKQPAPAKQSKPVKEKTSKPSPLKKIHKGKVMKVRKEKRVTIHEPDLGIIHKILEDDTSTNVIRDTSSPANAETGADIKKSINEMNTKILYVEEEHGEEVSNTVALKERTVELDESQAGLDPGQKPDYPKVHKSLKLTIEEHVHIKNPPISFEILSSMKNLDDAFTFGDQFLNDKSPEEEPGKANMETKVESMVTVPIYQASSSVPLLSTPIIDLTPPKPVSPPVEEPIIIATTATTTTLPLPPPPPQQSTTDFELATRVSTLEKICANFEKKNKLHDKTAEALSSRVFESGPNRSHPNHIALYDALEISMDRENREGSSKKKSASSSEQPVDDVPILDDVHLLESEDTDAARLPKIKTRPEWLKRRIDLMNPEGNWVVHDISKPLPLAGPPVTPPDSISLRHTFLAVLHKVLTKPVGSSEQTYEPTTAEEKQDRRNEIKARGTRLMALLNKDQVKFHSYRDAKLLMEAIDKGYEGNKESKKVQRTLRKQQYENFTASCSETLDQTFDRLQNLISQLELQGKVIQQEDMNLKLLTSLPSKWKTHALIWRNKAELETISLDDLYNNLKIYEPKISRSSNTNQNP